ncbi:unnamed protein product [Lymnaea stagnalis]|uniref:NADH dehydrogenase [ubiquinone] 1 beta subcomplex subunit 3 n=1 Tax=Lymnaea stagnalis TaxID=6523 RepID=A0AAV2HFF8_LYMST
MGGGGGGAPHSVPDWKIYKADGIPQLERLQNRLSALGLKDPWIRNEAWRYYPENGGSAGMVRVGLQKTFRGFGYAAVALALTIAYDKLTNTGEKHGHH